MAKKQPNGPKSHATKINAAEKRKRAVELRKAGAPYSRIGEELGVSRQRASKMVKEAMEELKAETVQETENLRQMEAQRLDTLQVGVWSRAVKGDLDALDRVLKISHRRSKMLALDKPNRVEVSGPGGGPIKHQQAPVLDYSRLTDKELSTLETILEKAAIYPDDDSQEEAE